VGREGKDSGPEEVEGGLVEQAGEAWCGKDLKGGMEKKGMISKEARRSQLRN
jgi:hypothetical protein